jgi:hypothetical protein
MERSGGSKRYEKLMGKGLIVPDPYHGMAAFTCGPTIWWIGPVVFSFWKVNLSTYGSSLPMAHGSRLVCQNCNSTGSMSVFKYDATSAVCIQRLWTSDDDHFKGASHLTEGAGQVNEQVEAEQARAGDFGEGALVARLDGLEDGRDHRVAGVVLRPTDTQVERIGLSVAPLGVLAAYDQADLWAVHYVRSMGELVLELIRSMATECP